MYYRWIIRLLLIKYSPADIYLAVFFIRQFCLDVVIFPNTQLLHLPLCGLAGFSQVERMS